jgi:hypothetical protein
MNYDKENHWYGWNGGAGADEVEAIRAWALDSVCIHGKTETNTRMLILISLLDAALSHPAPDVPGAEAVNTNDLRDYADRISNPYSQFILDAASNLDHARTDRNILQAELDAARAELAGVREAGQALVNFHNGPLEAKRPDVFQILISRLAAALAPLRDEGDGWQDISTAPKGVWVAAYRPSLSLPAGGWVASLIYEDGEWCDIRGNAYSPTHWQPLPTPPEGSEG